mgnify:CR=1 FL=1
MAQNLIINGIASHLIKRLVRTHTLNTDNPQYNGLQIALEGVKPADYSGQYYNTDLSLGLTEKADDITLKTAICAVARTLNVVETAINGRKGTVKESITAEDYTVDVDVTIANDTDEYPADAIRKLAELMSSGKSLFVDSDYLRLFDITMLAPKSFTLDTQSTEGNYQTIKLSFSSDDDYEVAVSAQ